MQQTFCLILLNCYVYGKTRAQSTNGIPTNFISLPLCDIYSRNVVSPSPRRLRVGYCAANCSIDITKNPFLFFLFFLDINVNAINRLCFNNGILSFQFNGDCLAF